MNGGSYQVGVYDSECIEIASPCHFVRQYRKAIISVRQS